MESGPSTTKIMLCGLFIVALIMIGNRVFSNNSITQKIYELDLSHPDYEDQIRKVDTSAYSLCWGDPNDNKEMLYCVKDVVIWRGDKK